MSYNKYDISLKELVEDNLTAWAGLARASAQCQVKVINAEISTLEARADKVLKVHDSGEKPWLLNLEFQARHD